MPPLMFSDSYVHFNLHLPPNQSFHNFPDKSDWVAPYLVHNCIIFLCSTVEMKDYLAGWVTNYNVSGLAIAARNKSLAKMATLKLQMIARDIWLYRQYA